MIKLISLPLKNFSLKFICELNAVKEINISGDFSAAHRANIGILESSTTDFT